MQHVIIQYLTAAWRFRLSTTTALALAHLGQPGVEILSASKLAELCGITSAAATDLIDRLVKQGLARRVKCQDRRVVGVMLTQSGKSFVSLNTK